MFVRVCEEVDTLGEKAKELTKRYRGERPNFEKSDESVLRVTPGVT